MKDMPHPRHRKSFICLGLTILLGLLGLPLSTIHFEAEAFSSKPPAVATAGPSRALQAPANPPCAKVQTFGAPTNVPLTIPDGLSGCIAQTVTSTITVSGAGTFLQDLNMQTFIEHPFSSDLHVTLTSPQGTTATVTTKNAGGGPRANVYNGTVWDDQANPAGGPVLGNNNNGLVTDHLYVTNTLASPLVPEEGFAVFNGEDPNGVWTLTLGDDFITSFPAPPNNVGRLTDWSLQVASLSAAPTTTTSGVFSNTTAQTISATGTPTVTSTITVAGVTGVLSDLVLTTDISHTRNDNLDITLMSPTGKICTITSDNGRSAVLGNAGNVFGRIPTMAARSTVWTMTADNRAANTPDAMTGECAGFEDSDDDFPRCVAAGARCDELPHRSFRINTGFFSFVYYNNGTVVDHRYVPDVLASPLTPEESLGVFFGDDPNGTWTLTIRDDASGSGGMLNEWALQFTTRDTAMFNPCNELPTLYVADTQNHRIQRFDGINWTVIGGIGTIGVFPGQFNLPEAVTASLDGMTVVVADTGNNRIQRTTDAGATWNVIATQGFQTNKVNSPRGVALDTLGNLYVADTNNNRIVRYTNGDPNMAVVLATTGIGPGQVRTPHGVAVDANFNLYIADTGNGRILKIANAHTAAVAGTGTLIAGTGIGLNQVRSPQGVGTDSAGNLYVADTANERVLVFPNGAPGPATVLATIGSSLGQVRLPEGVTVSAFTQGALVGSTIVVGDTMNNRIQGRLVAGLPWVLVGAPNGLGSITPGMFRLPSQVR